MESVRVNKEVLRRKRKILLWVPVILIPLVTLGFYAMGGGKGDHTGKGLLLTKGLNMSLPEAKFDRKKKEMNKLGAYKQSEQDSLKLRETRKMDPYYRWKDSAAGTTAFVGNVAMNKSGQRLDAATTEAQAGDLMRKLDQLKGALGRQRQGVLPEWSSAHSDLDKVAYPNGTSFGNGALSGNPLTPYPVDPGKAGLGDPDLDKLNALMDKVLRVRYPGDAPIRDTASAEQMERPMQSLTVEAPVKVMSTLSGDGPDDLETGFIDLDAGQKGDTLVESMIPAVIDGEQTMLSGETAVLRTAAEAMLGGIRVPKGTRLSGKAVLSGERLFVSVNAVRVGSRVIPVALDVVDMDGITGIRVRGSINRDVAKESGSEAVGSLGIMPMDGGVTGQATAAGLQAAKNLLSRKMRLVRVGLPEGYRVLLRNSKVNH